MTCGDSAPMPVVRSGAAWVVIDKPADLLSVPGRGPDKQDCTVSRVKAMFPEATGPMVVHRLDMDTSGLMLVALDAPVQRTLSMQFESRTIEKQYEAIVQGEPKQRAGEIRLRQRLDVDHRPLQILDEAQGKLAVTRWRFVESASACDWPPARTEQASVFSRIVFSPITGRSHQLRLAAATLAPIGLGCPIVGDDLYGAGKPIGGRLLLAATRLAFDDPATGERIDVARSAPF